MTKLKLFQWRAVNRLQQKQKGLIVAETEAMAQQQLLSRGLQNIKLQQNWQFSHKPKNADICTLLSQLATLLQAAVPLKNSLQILLQNCTNIALNRWLRCLLQEIESGLAFSQALEQQGLYLTYQERQLIQVGEMTGKLAAVCHEIAQHKQQALALQRKIQKILLYPLLVLGISLILTALLLLFIVPQFAAMYDNSNAQLPAFTQVLLTLSQGLQDYWFALLIFIALTVALIRFRLKHSPWLNRQKTRLINGIPLLNRIVQLSRLVGFSRSLFLMLQAGIPLNQALQSFLPKQQSWQTKPQQQGDWLLLAEVQSALHWIQQGYPFSASVSGQIFPPAAQQMLQVGEQSGQLPKMLQFIANDHQQQLDHQIDLLSQMLEPLLMVIIGGLIGLIMLGMYLPIFNMGSLVQ
ncbi:type II secretion system F family protein [Aggregatibacter actinomycetemcomitans]|uniref:type II secretion system F family protein n=1 Tax=Aggregatibacter actinomycetemcomitans TaxID=714 RepID=UPI00197C7F9E|nr:type II secretion system F family protein [Aggregatibacter actinomycetemcomitans]MBN6067564.1 type II secretion system F family protein [Aggregatibacter actinomycetemcomitans]MBN6085406.1 type II secretion system F family protein [Aggregatibacter actinomycetemcomitans]